MEIFNSLHEHFYLKITIAQLKVRAKIDPNIEYYLVNLLSDLHLSEKTMFEHFDATVNGHNRLLAAKALGDEALITTSIFPEFAKRRGLSIDYTVSMGKGGYLIASEIFRYQIRDKHFADMYLEMSNEFGTLRNILRKTVDIFNIE